MAKKILPLTEVDETVYLPSSVEEANNMIARYGEVNREMTRLKDHLASRVARLTQATDTRVRPLEDEKQQLQRNLEAFASNNPSFFQGKKSHQFPNGILGWRKGKMGLLITVSLELLVRRLRKLADPGRYFSIEIKIHQQPLLRDKPVVKGLVYVPAQERFYVDPTPEVASTREVVPPPPVTTD